MTNQSEQIKPAPVADETTFEKVQKSPRSIVDIVRDLSKPLPARWLKTKPVGRKGDEVTFIEWPTAARYLDFHAAGWSYHIKSVSQVGNLVVVVASISIPCAEGIVTREATGIEDINATGYGDPVSSASAMALKRCAALFGLGLYLYSK